MIESVDWVASHLPQNTLSTDAASTARPAKARHWTSRFGCPLISAGYCVFDLQQNLGKDVQFSCLSLSNGHARQDY